MNHGIINASSPFVLASFILASRYSKVDFPIVSGNKRLVNADSMDKLPIKMNGNGGLINFKLSVRSGAGMAPTRDENEAKLSPWALENKMCKNPKNINIRY